MDTAELRRRFAGARVCSFVSIRPDGRPHVVPVTFALPDDDEIVWAVDHKPKRSDDLQRLRNVRSHPHVSLLAQHYEDDWTRLWWVRADGRAAIHEDGPVRAEAVAALAERYAPYRERPPEGPVVRVSVDRWSGWEP